MQYSLRPYQVRAIEELRSLVSSGVRRICLVSPTGSGKTVTAAAIVESAASKGKRILFLAHRKELIDQCSAKLDDIGVDHGIIMADHPRARALLPVQVASVQTLIRREAKPYDLVIVDECHHARSDSYGKILDSMPSATVIGLTATPERGDGLGLGKIFQEQVTVSTPGELISEGFLVDPQCYAASRVDLSGVHTVAGDYNEGELAAIMGDKILLGNIVDNWRRLAGGVRTVAFAVTVNHSRQITESFLAAGIPAEHLDGTTPKLEREGILARLRSGETKIVSNCMVLTEGWDCPDLGALILARPTQSRSLFMQMAGRVMRTAPGKDKALILDHADCIRKHGFPSDDYAWEMLDGDRAVVCPQCGAAMRPGVSQCTACGLDLPKRATAAATPRITEVVEVDGELRLIERKSTTRKCPKCTSENTKKFRTPKIGNFTVGIKCNICKTTSFEPDSELAMTATGADKRKEYRRLLAFARNKGFKDGWASHQYRNIFGCWPAGFVNSIKQELSGGIHTGQEIH